MSDLIKKLEEMVSPGPSGSDSRVNQVPEAWRPRLEIDQDGGYFVSTPKFLRGPYDAPIHPKK